MNKAKNIKSINKDTTSLDDQFEYWKICLISHNFIQNLIPEQLLVQFERNLVITCLWYPYVTVWKLFPIIPFWNTKDLFFCYIRGFNFNKYIGTKTSLNNVYDMWQLLSVESQNRTMPFQAPMMNTSVNLWDILMKWSGHLFLIIMWSVLKIVNIVPVACTPYM